MPLDSLIYGFVPTKMNRKMKDKGKKVQALLMGIIRRIEKATNSGQFCHLQPLKQSLLIVGNAQQESDIFTWGDFQEETQVRIH